MLDSIDKEHLKRALYYAPYGVSVVDKEGYWKWVNHRLCDLLGYTSSELTSGMTWQDLTPDAKEREHDQKMVDKVLSGDIPSYTMLKTYRTKSKREILCKLTAVENKEGDLPTGDFLFFWSYIEPAVEIDSEYLKPSPRNPNKVIPDSGKVVSDFFMEHWVKILGGLIVAGWLGLTTVFMLGKAYEKFVSSKKPTVIQIAPEFFEKYGRTNEANYKK
jgi:PAS domain S-box-containing protein